MYYQQLLLFLLFHSKVYMHKILHACSSLVQYCICLLKRKILEVEKVLEEQVF
jgi:hypothetical protein